MNTELFTNSIKLIWTEPRVACFEQPMQRVTCPECSEIFVNTKGLGIHLSKIHVKTEKTHVCVDCYKFFKNKCLLKAHKLQVHLKVSKIECPKCMKILSNKFTLKNHIKKYHQPIAEIQ